MVEVPATLTQSQRQIRNLIGVSTTSACILVNPDGEMGIYFIFSSLGIRAEGIYKLRISFTTGLPMQGKLDSITSIVMSSSVFSEPFTVYTPREYPGVVGTTALSKCFMDQGMLINTRSGGSRYRA
ncbi:hypothetical protein BZG36_04194 [Bifiguratus adelaidae]|uniref:Velvet domain-containing protein n=1 Tax=Bifiguratus adelaidae TaxID=1938954 RepID=A0A261XW56_9FUNG|nr:hypothetical protein BZG36_04194 [Bifiguratus adelaidae]